MNKKIILRCDENPWIPKYRQIIVIAITILILEIKIPTHEQLQQYNGLYHYLMHIWPSVLGYLIEIVLIGIYWSNYSLFNSNCLHVLLCFLPPDNPGDIDTATVLRIEK